MSYIFSHYILFGFLAILGVIACQTEFVWRTPADQARCAAQPLITTAQDQRAYISICVQAGTPREEVILNLRRALGARNAYSRSYINRLYNQYDQCTRTGTERCEVPGRPITATDDEHEDLIRELMSRGRTWTLDELAEQTGIGRTTVHRILKKLDYKKIGPKWIPHTLTCEQKAKRVAVCRRNIALYNRDPERFIERVITMDESWIRCYDPLDPQQAREWRQPGEEPCIEFYIAKKIKFFYSRPIQAGAELRDWKVLMAAAIHNDSIAGWQFLETGQTMNGERFLAFLRNVVAPIIRRKRIRRPLILMDNARPHYTDDVKEYIRTMGWEILEHPPYSPDISPCDYDLFNRIKRPLRGRRFEDRPELIRETEAVMTTLNRESRLVGMSNLVNRWKQVVEKKGEYLDH